MSLKTIAALALTVAAAGLVAPSSLAEPALPKTWVAGAPGLKDPSGAKPKEELDQKTLEMRRRSNSLRQARSIDIDTLPVIPIAKARPAGEIPAEIPSAPAGDVVVIKAGGGARRINVVGFAAGVLFVNRSAGYFGPPDMGGLTNVCGPGVSGNPLKGIRYEALRRADKEGSVEFVMGKGFIETATCRVAIEERWSVQPAKMAGGLLLGFRTRCDECAEGSRDVLHVVTPQLNDFFDRISPIEHHAFSLEKGAIKILTGFTSRHDSLSFKVPDWSDVSDRGCAKPEKSCSHGVRIEVSRAESEAKATVIVTPNLSDQ
ncbi:MAG TPA: hypothetical protein VE093_01975 [Polyangiaceae bacterium]|nr:hypothetical protein [Polyangiaceae bacterium]